MAIPYLCALAAATGLTLAGCASAPPPPPLPEGQPAFYRNLATAGAKVDTSAARDMISLYRANKGLGPLTLDPTLQQAAQAQADAMARAGQVSHGPGPLQTRLARYGANPSRAAENVSAGYYTMAEAFSGWRDSRPHNTNMLNPAVKRMGIATAFAPGTKYKVYWALIVTD
ncbi:MAG: CAP domain-containing protein [Beijerinckiaceae bacterium]|nr:CAP domain-containing protein [Beijerinckiaceae bacterium]